MLLVTDEVAVSPFRVVNVEAVDMRFPFVVLAEAVDIAVQLFNG